MAQINVDELPVVSSDDQNTIITMISKRDIIGYYYEQIRETK